MRRLTIIWLATAMLSAGVADQALADRSFSERDVRGPYSFSFEGEIVSVGPVAAVGRFDADGRGNITNAVRTLAVNGVTTSQTFHCTITVNPDGTGSAECPLDDPLPDFPATETFDFVLEQHARAFRLLGTTPGVVVLGGGQRQ
jgi:hypothetical protein